jgi:hypothetical protein
MAPDVRERHLDTAIPDCSMVDICCRARLEALTRVQDAKSFSATACSATP